MSKFSFAKGFGQVQLKDADEVKAKIMAVFEIKNRTSWSDRLNGRIEPTVSQHESVEQVFHSLGITDIWDE